MCMIPGLWQESSLWLSGLDYILPNVQRPQHSHVARHKNIETSYSEPFWLKVVCQLRIPPSIIIHYHLRVPPSPPWHCTRILIVFLYISSSVCMLCVFHAPDEARLDWNCGCAVWSLSSFSCQPGLVWSPKVQYRSSTTLYTPHYARLYQFTLYSSA